MDEQHMWIKSRRRRRLRLLAVTLVFCLLFTTYPNILETLSVFAAGTQSGDGTVHVTGFAGLTEEVREQTVPVGTGVEELMLPDTLEAVIAISEGEALPEDAEEETQTSPENAEEETETSTESTEEETEASTESTEEETEIPQEGTGEETESPETEGTEAEEPADDTQPEEETDGENAAPDNEGSQTEESQGTEPEGTAEETVATEEAAIPENSDNAGGSGESAPSVQAEDAKLTQETHTVTMPEYQAENVITVETIENTQETGTKEETVTIEGITWQSETAYDGNTEGIYIFTAVLPEGYALMEGVGLPQITVTVQADSADSVIQALLDRIAALPDSEAYLAKEPDIESEEAYAEWMEGLYQYAGEALDIQEAYEALTEEQQAQIPEEAFAKLTAWAEIAEQIAENDRVMLAAVEPTPGVISSDQEWSGGYLSAGTYTIQPGVTVTVTDTLVIEGVTVTINGGGTLKRAFAEGTEYESDSIIKVDSYGELILDNVIIDGNSISIDAQGPAVYVNDGTVTMQSGSVIQNNYNANTSIKGSKAAGGIYCEEWGTLQIDGGTIQNCRTNKNVDTQAYSHAGGGIYLKGICEMTSGSITGNQASNGGGIYLASEGATLELSGGTIEGNSVAGNGAGIYYSTVNGATSTLVIGGDANVQDVIYLDITSGDLYPYITSSLRHKITLACSEVNDDSEGRVLLGGKDYTLTIEDARMVSMQNTNLYSRLDSGQNQIYLSLEECGHESIHIQKVSAKEATCLAAGNKEYYICTACVNLFSDSTGSTPTTLEDVTIAQKSHNYTYTASGAVITEKCVNGCGHSATATLTLKDDADLTYTGNAITPLKVERSDNWAGSQPAIAYSANINVGIVSAKIKYRDATANTTFTIVPKPLTAGMITLASGSYSYTGSEIKPAVTVEDGGKTLTSGTDYTVSYSNNTSVGNSAKVEITGKGNYTGTINKTFAITAADISGATVTLSSTTLTYNGSAQTKGVTSVKIGSTMLTEGTDYTVSGNTGTAAGTYTITITGIGSYGGSTTTTFTIERKSLTADMVSIASGPYYYNGSGITPAVTVKDGGKTLTSGTDYTVSYENNVNVGTSAEVTVTGKGNYTGTIRKTFAITAADISGATVTLSSTTLTYNGSVQTKGVTSVKIGSTTLTEGTDYTVSGNTGTDAGEYTITITGKGGYAGSTKRVTYTIERKSLTADMVSIASGSYYYNGSGITPTVTVEDGGNTLTSGTDYTVSYENNVNVGTSAEVTVTGKGNYTGTIEKTFEITAADISGATVTLSSTTLTYNGSAQTIGVTSVKIGSTMLTEGTDYMVSGNTGTDAGTYTITITGKGNYTGTLRETFTIEYRQLPSGSLTNYVTISPEPTNGWYGSDITLTPKDDCEVGETPAGTGNSAVTISQETGTGAKIIYIKDADGNIYQTEFSYKLDKTPPVVNLTGMTVENGTTNLLNWIIGKKSMIIKIPVSDVTDVLSGVEEVTYTAQPDNGTAQSGTPKEQDGYYQIALNEQFSGTIQLTVKDNAGNTANVSLTADSGKVIAEDYPPVVTFALTDDTLTPNAGGWYNTAVTIKVTVTDNKDNGSADILSGGIAEISWKDGESGTVQTVTGLPGNSPVYEKEFTISVNTDGTHTYYVNAVDNAGNESGWQTYTVKADTGKPVFNGNPTAKNPTEGGADITFTSSESGKVYWIVSDGGTTPTEQEVKEQGEQNGGVQDIAGGTEGSFTITGLSAGEKHTVYVVLEDAAGNLSEVKQKSFFTLQEAPNITPEQVRVDYIHETITLLGIGTVEVYTDPQDPENSKITPNAEDGSLPVTPGTAVYIRYPKKTEDGMTVPASDKTTIQIPSRPDKPAAKQVTVTDTTAAVTNPASGEEYVYVEKGQTPDWSNANTTGQFTGLAPNKEYDLYVRKRATGSSFASDSVKTEVRTSVTIKEPVITGDGADKSGNTAPKPDTPNADGTVTFTGTYSEEYTPVIRIGSQEYTPEMTWDVNSGKGSWEYTYPIPGDAPEVESTVEFRKRTLTGIEVEPDALTIYADDAANESLDTLTAYVKANSSAEAVYDNKTSGAVQAAYSTTGSFAQKGAAYTYTASAEGKTDNTTLTVKTVSAAVTAPDKYMQVQKNGGYTSAEVAAWLPTQVKVTYTGTGYTARTENRTVTWDTASIGSGFGSATGKETITGTVELPLWAAGGNSVSMVIEFVDKIVLRDDQIQLTVPDFSYGAQTLPNPQGSITVADTNPVYTYRYSTDGGSTWVAADRLPKSGGGYIIPGSYRVEMTYRGDSYTGGKTVSFTVAEKELTILPGTLEAESRNDDGTKDAILKEGGKPVLSGAAAGDDVTLGGSLSAVFAEAGPKKNIPVTVTGFTLEGRDAGYYKLKNTTLTLYATINNADGTPPSDGNGNNGGNSGGNGGGNGGETSGGDGSNGNGGGNGVGDGSGNTDENSGGDSNSEDGSNTQENNNGSDTPAATRKPTATQPPVTSSAAGKQPTSGAGIGPGRNGGTQPDGTNNPDNGAAAGNTGPLKPGIEPGNTDQAGQDSTAPAQTEGEAAQTLQASVDSGKLTITGDLVTTGNITEASETTTILKAGDGAVIVTVVCGDGQYTAGVSDTVAVANAVLTPEQIELVNDGETIEIRVDVKDISETVPGQDKEIIESGLVEYRKEMPGLTLGMYVDISLFVKVGEGGWDAVTHTEEPIDVVVGIPEELKGDGREFSIIRSHDGEYTLLPDTDDDPDTITVSTDMFSAYALVYVQAEKAEASVPGESGIKCGLCQICPTFLGICCFIWLAVIVAIFLIIGVVIWRKRKEER